MAQLKDLLVTGSARIIGKVYSPEFVGKLTGNAATATKANRAIADEDGSNIKTYLSNATINGRVITLTSPSGKKLQLTTQDTNTWRGIQNNVTSDSTTDSLSAAQGKYLKGLIDGKSNKGHNHDERYYTETEIDNKLKTYLLLTGGTLTGLTRFQAGTDVWNAIGTAGTAGYIKIAIIKVKSSYANAPIEIAFSRRNDTSITRITIAFNSADSIDPTLRTFTVAGSTRECWLAKSATSTWDLYIEKTERYDNIGITSFYTSNYSRSNISVTWSDTQATAIPEGATQASYGWYVYHASLADTATNATNASKATNDSGGQNIRSTYISSVEADKDNKYKYNFKTPTGAIKNSITIYDEFQKRSQVNATTDWNTLTSTGIYKVQMSAWGDATKMHSPNSYNKDLYSFGILLVFESIANDSEKRFTQIYIPHKDDISISSSAYKRLHNGSDITTGWQSWHPIARGLNWSELTGKPSTFPPSPHTHNYAGSSSAGGAATSANKLTTARKISLTGSVTGSVSFDGSGDISITTTTNHTHAYLPLAGGTMTGNIAFPYSKGILQNQNNTSNYTKALIWKKDGKGWYYTDTDGTSKKYTYDPHIGQHNTGGDGYGSVVILPYATNTDPWNGTVGLYISKNSIKIDNNTILHSSNYTSYTVTKTGSGASGTWGISISGSSASSASCTGNAATATKLQTSRKIFGKSFNGSEDIAGQGFFYGTYTSTASNRYLNGGLQIRENEQVGSTQTDIGYAPSIGFHWSKKIAASLLFHNDGIFYFRKQDGTSRATIDANVNGTASSADKLATARTITLSGAVTGSVSFNGSANVTLTTSVNHTHSQYYDSNISRAENTVLAAPSGSAGKAIFRKLVAADIPILTKSKISDFPASLKNPNALTITLNGGGTEGTNKFTYDGSVAKTINITPSGIGAAISGHTHNYAGSNSAGGSANSAIKLATARKISLTGLGQGSANFDGSGDISIDDTGYGCKKYVTKDAITAPYFRIAYFTTKNTYTDASMIFVIDSGFKNGGYGIVKVAFRADNCVDKDKSSCEVLWLVRQGFEANQLFVKGYAPAGGTQYVDLYFKATGTYQAVTIRVLSSGGRGSQSRNWTFEESEPLPAATIRTYSYTTEGFDAGTANLSHFADKLQTPRIINGTSFNGGANITTANWGTARNIYIRDCNSTNTGTAVSVNGSGNAYLLMPSTARFTGSVGIGSGSGATLNFYTTASSVGAKIVAYNNRIEFVFA